MNERLQPERLLMTTDTVGGVWDYSLELCRGLGEHGVSVLLATLGPRPRPQQRHAVAALRHVTLCESDYRLEWMNGPWDDVERAGDWLQRMASEFGAGLVHLNSYAPAARVWDVPVLVVAHSCVLSWWQAVHGKPAPAAWTRYRDAVQAGLHAADHVLAPTHAMLSALEAGYGRLPSAAVVPNGRDGNAFTFTREKEPLILSVGRLWDDAKNITALASIAPLLPWPVHVAGNPAAPDGRTAALPHVVMHGHCDADALRNLYARAAIYALPARYEPFGLSVLEAAWSGCALVLGDIPSLRELWDGAAVFVPPRDPADLGGAIERLIASPAERARLAERARARASRFSARRMIDSYLEIYGRLMTAPRVATPAPLCA